jgi:hypothetical protein
MSQVHIGTVGPGGPVLVRRADDVGAVDNAPPEPPLWKGTRHGYLVRDMRQINSDTTDVR